MKKYLFMLATGLVLLFSNCTNQRIKSLESENSQLKEQIDSLNILLEETRGLMKVLEERADKADLDALYNQLKLDSCKRSIQKD
jgi:hypothetical protein